MATLLVAHGAWGAGWFWRKMRPLLRARGHELFTPSLTGTGERVHLAHAGVNLETHITDLLHVIEYEDLDHIVLIGHSYGGLVATGVADRVSARIAHLVYLDALVPREGDSFLSMVPETIRTRLLEAAAQSGDGWRVPANPMPPDTDGTDVDWAVPRRVMQPLASFSQALRLTGAVERLPRTYIYCTRFGPGDIFRPSAQRARTEPGWRYLEMDASHNPHVTAPEALAELLDGIACGHQQPR